MPLSSLSRLLAPVLLLAWTGAVAAQAGAARPREIQLPAAVVEQLNRTGSVTLSVRNLQLRLAEGFTAVVARDTVDLVVVVDDVIVGTGHEFRNDALRSLDIESVEVLKGAAAAPFVNGLVVVRTDRSASRAAILEAARATNAERKPLIIVDGVLITGAVDVTSDRIEAVEVLKGAAAARLYGERAANGVIIIRTKR
jgi:TonB-dependent SusC/RagA subfamily outer membrane receptor